MGSDIACRDIKVKGMGFKLFTFRTRIECFWFYYSACQIVRIACTNIFYYFIKGVVIAIAAYSRITCILRKGVVVNAYAIYGGPVWFIIIGKGDLLISF